MQYLILVAATLAATGKALFCKLVGNSKGRYAFFVNFKAFLTAFLVSLIFAANELSKILNISAFSLVLSIAFGFSVAFTQFTQMKAMNEGPASLTMLIYSSAFVIPIVFAVAAWGESVSAWQILGIALLIVSIALIVVEPHGKRINFLWIVFVACATLGSGINAIIQKVHQMSAYKSELKLFLVLALFFSALFSLLFYLIYRPKEAESPKETKGAKGVLFPIFLGISVGVLNFMNLMLAGVVPAVIQFTICNVGSLILTSAFSIVFFKEKIEARRMLGYALGIAAILVIGLL